MRIDIRKKLDFWRFYSFEQEQYQKCMDKLFINNLYNLHKINIAFAICVGCSTLYPILVDKDLIKAGIYLTVAIVALLLAVFANYKMQTALVNNRLIYILTTLFYINVMSFGIYMCVWATPDKLATTFLCFLICALLMFVNSPRFNLSLTLGAIIVFTISTVMIKSPENYFVDIINTCIAGLISLSFNWQITRLRIGLELSTSMLEDDRDKYLDQSTTDELTQLSNRRDFMQTFQRYLSNYRTSDDWLCVAISDIDFFKNYNDHYGHPQGDECLRSIGRAFNQLKENLGVYAARVGGEEFAILWFEKDISHVDTVVSDMTNLIKELKIPHAKSKVSEYVTMSMGIYVERCGSTTDEQTLYDLADKALYAAKGSGRNCTIVCGREIAQYKIPV
ncbi:MAG: GGDEF domain-containing protein [Treponema sp.]|nr:GGDEF domain-containing protein [Treponema sp.]